MYNFYCKKQSELKQIISNNYRSKETACVSNLLASINITPEQEQNATKLASTLIEKVRNKRIRGTGIDAIMNKFKLSTNEGLALMCLAESLLRIPDKATQNKLIKDKITKGNWAIYTKTENSFINAASWGLLISGKITKPTNKNLTKFLLSAIAKGGEPLIRRAMITAVRFMGNQFVIGETIEKALKKATKKESAGYQFSYDMLGEAALTEEDAQHYMQSYIEAIHKVGQANNGRGVIDGPGISVKLSAIHSRYQRSQYQRVITELYPRLKELYLLAKQYKIALFIDAEESDRLELSLDLLNKLVNDDDISGYEGIGFVIQAYQKRAPYVIDYIVDMAKMSKTRIMVRLVKGAYWDSEIKKAQIDGQIDYPVYTRKFYTDLSYIVCAQKLFTCQQEIYPLFATHNAYTLALIYELGKNKEFEFQCLYGMGETLYDNIVGKNNLNKMCRIYAPVGTYKTLLAYLVRRLLENGANSSFVQQIVDKTIPIAKLIESPIALSRAATGEPNPNFSNPLHIYKHNRLNSAGFDLSNENTLCELQKKLNQYSSNQYMAYPLLANYSLLSKAQKIEEHTKHSEAKPVYNPADTKEMVGRVIRCKLDEVNVAIENAVEGLANWSSINPNTRADILIKMAALMELNSIELIDLLMREAGKTITNAISEVREAVDFCRYYAQQAKQKFCNADYSPVGVMVCISPWNFPLAIFIGEISSSLVVGNTVIAKPSDQTNLIAFYAVRLFYQAGIPTNALQLMPGSGSIIGNALTQDSRVKGVIFTGSTDTAQLINKNLASKDFDAVLIAETGGQNAMIVDSSALPEQVVADVIASGFDSAGQRCSALRVLYLQADIANEVIDMIKGAMADLKIGNPMNIDTDIGPVIDIKAQQGLLKHIEDMRRQARQVYQAELNQECKNGTFVAPTLIEIGSIKELKQEVFGPVIHVIRFANNQLDKVIDEINSSGYGLTQGVHSRIEDTITKVYERIKAGNIYVNRNMVGAVVGIQPFGGEGLSGTGPKAGGALYLYRLVNTNINPHFDTTEPAYKFDKVNDFLSNLDILTNKEKIQLVSYAKIILKQVLFMQRVELQGPTGEQNFIYFDKRGVIGCFANTQYDYAQQIICALATGNKVILPYNNTTKGFSKIIPNHIAFCESIDDVEDLNAVLISHNFAQVKQLKMQLAKRCGCLVVNIIEREDGSYPLYLLTTERSVSINITATGGNVELMSINDKI